MLVREAAAFIGMSASHLRFCLLCHRLQGGKEHRGWWIVPRAEVERFRRDFRLNHGIV